MANSFTPNRVLFVDDDASTRELYPAYLATRGDYYLASADGVEEAIRLLAQDSFDVAVIDWNMPDGGGRRLLGHLVEFWPELGRIVLSAHPFADSDSAQLGGHEFVDKAAHRDVFRNAVERALRTSAERWSRPPEVPDWFVRPLAECLSLPRISASVNLLCLPRWLRGIPVLEVLMCTQAPSAGRLSPFRAINCRGISGTEFRQYLCGRGRPRETNARGAFDLAMGGTVAIRNVGELATAEQEWLADRLVRGTYSRIGADRSIPIRAVVVFTEEDCVTASPHALSGPLRQLVLDNTYDFCGISPETVDVSALTQRMLDIACSGTKRLDTASRWWLRHLPPMIALTDLRHTVGHVIETVSSENVSPEDLALPFVEGRFAQIHDRTAGLPAWREARDEFEAYYFMRLLAETEGNITRTASVAGMRRQAVYQKIKTLQIDLSAFKPA